MIVAHLQRFTCRSNLKEQLVALLKSLMQFLALKNVWKCGQSYTEACGHPWLSNDFVPSVTNVLSIFSIS